MPTTFVNQQTAHANNARFAAAQLRLQSSRTKAAEIEKKAAAKASHPNTVATADRLQAATTSASNFLFF